MVNDHWNILSWSYYLMEKVSNYWMIDQLSSWTSMYTPKKECIFIWKRQNEEINGYSNECSVKMAANIQRCSINLSLVVSFYCKDGKEPCNRTIIFNQRYRYIASYRPLSAKEFRRFWMRLYTPVGQVTPQTDSSTTLKWPILCHSRVMWSFTLSVIVLDLVPSVWLDDY